jgi:DNA-binding MarR family transcriptional regulator
MAKSPGSRDAITLPALLRHARTAYAVAMRTALAQAGYGDIPKNGLYVIGGLALLAGNHPLGKLIEDLRLSKQAAGYLVDMLVTRGYLDRQVDSEDRRRLTIDLTKRGRGAANVLIAAGAAVDAELLSRVGPKDVERTRRTLLVLVEIGHRLASREYCNGNSTDP